MSIKYVDNILFQKAEFPEIYKSYYDENSNIVRANFQCKKDSKYLYVLVEEEIDPLGLIAELFYTNFDYDNKSYDTCILTYDIDESISEMEKERGVIKVSINHPFLTRNSAILISKVLKERFLQKTSAFFTYRTKPLEQLQELQIHKYFNYKFKNSNFKTAMEMKECIRTYEAEYKLELLVSDSEKKQYFEGIKITEKVSLDIIKIINDSWGKKENLIFQQCIDRTLDVFSIRSKEIVRNNLYPGSFESNFVCIEKYFAFIDKMEKNISTYFDENIIPAIKKYKKEFDTYIVLHNSLSSDRGIIGLDDYIQEELEKLSKVLEG